MKVTVLGKTYEKQSPLNLEQFKDELGLTAFGVKVNNRLRELSFNLTYDAELEYLDLTSNDSIQIYTASIRFLIAMAVERLYQGARVIFFNSISRKSSIFR